ncbi:TPA: hypothetical protein JLV08_001550, partial [Escherichia coli]|nr:hypothetical protein [Escherichia coli]HAW1828443.1 hypothetical protein [Escherichia coli]HAW4002878.1 hypothetical protein [Escherichia coli]HBB1738227.1 hypothetical protein [Escherichia coli]HCA4508946.1 50S ribosomal protein L31 [Escherichia coli]
MKPNIHPEYRTVVFHDTSVDEYGNDSNLLIVFYVQIMPD